MNLNLSYLLVLSGLTMSALAPGAPGAPPAARPEAPPIPTAVEPGERAVLLQSARLLGRGQFDEATGLLRSLLPGPVVRVYVDWPPVPSSLRPGYSQAVAQALEGWNHELAPGIRFELAAREADAHLILLIERSVARLNRGQVQLVCAEGGALERPAAGAPAAPLGRVSRARIALTVPYTETSHTPSSISHLVGQMLGAYLGLPPATEPTGVMGPDTHGNSLPLKPTPGEGQQARDLQQVRLQLVELARRRVVVHARTPVLAVDRTEIDAGEVMRGDRPHFVYRLRNSGDAPLEIEAKPTCGCTVANYDRVIPPGGEGKIEAELQTATFRGPTAKTIVVTSNDQDQPQLVLHLAANVIPVVRLVPDNPPILALSREEPTTREFRLELRDTEAVEVSEVITTPAYASAAVEPLESQGAAAARAYRLTVTVRPEAPVGRSSVALTLRTTSKREPSAAIRFACEKGIVVTPASVYMGGVRPETPLPLTRVVSLRGRDAAFHLRKVESSDPKLEVRQETVRDGSEYRLRVSYTGGWPAGAMRGTITVETDDPAQPRIAIPVQATVIAAAEAPR